MIEKSQKYIKYKVILNYTICVPLILLCVDDIILHRKMIVDTKTYYVTLLI